MLDCDTTGFCPSADALVEGVVRVLKEAYPSDLPQGLERQDQFAFDVVLNALCSVLENVRAKSPDQYSTYLQMSLLTLQGD